MNKVFDLIFNIFLTKYFLYIKTMKMNKHLKVRHKSLRYKMKNNVITLNYVKSEQNLADQLTKGLSRTVVLESSRRMGLSP